MIVTGSRNRRRISLAQTRYLAFLSALLLAVFSGLLVAFNDFDGDGLDDDWEAAYGFSTNAYSHLDLIGWWPLNETNGSIAPDRSTNNLPLTLVDSPAWVPGLFSQCDRLRGEEGPPRRNAKFGLQRLQLRLLSLDSTATAQKNKRTRARLLVGPQKGRLADQHR
jgi:hypothetical protein